MDKGLTPPRFDAEGNRIDFDSALVLEMVRPNGVTRMHECANTFVWWLLAWFGLYKLQSVHGRPVGSIKAACQLACILLNR